MVPLYAFSLDTFTLLVLDAVQPVGRAVLPSKSAQIVAPQPPELELLELDELELDELLELEEELLELEELLEELLDELELLELDDELVVPEPPQAARVQVATMIGINLRMLVLPHLLL